MTNFRVQSEDDHLLVPPYIGIVVRCIFVYKILSQSEMENRSNLTFKVLL